MSTRERERMNNREAHESVTDRNRLKENFSDS